MPANACRWGARLHPANVADCRRRPATPRLPHASAHACSTRIPSEILASAPAGVAGRLSSGACQTAVRHVFQLQAGVEIKVLANQGQNPKA